jgi:hypothetical protein
VADNRALQRATLTPTLGLPIQTLTPPVHRLRAHHHCSATSQLIKKLSSGNELIRLIIPELVVELD